MTKISEGKIIIYMPETASYIDFSPSKPFFHERTGEIMGQQFTLLATRIPLAAAITEQTLSASQKNQLGSLREEITQDMMREGISQHALGVDVAALARDYSLASEELPGGYAIRNVRLGLFLTDENPFQPITEATVYIAEPGVTEHKVLRDGLPHQLAEVHREENSAYLFEIETPEHTRHMAVMFNKVSSHRETGQIAINSRLLLLIQLLSQRGILCFSGDGIALTPQ